MSASYDVNLKSLCLRYVVPFCYKETFEEAFHKVESQAQDPKLFWARKLVGADKRESDVFDYVRNEFCFDNAIGSISAQKAGCEWVLSRKDKQNTEIKQFLHFPNKKIEGNCCKAYYFNGNRYQDNRDKICFNPAEAREISISNAGLRLFRNGLGLLWYELKLPLALDSGQLMQFQNKIKELNRKITSLWEELEGKPEYGIELFDKYVAPFSLGKWVNDTLGFLEVQYLAERKSAYQSMLKNSMKKLEGFPSLKSENKGAAASKPMSPDKAILFTYACFRSKDENDSLRDKYALTYHITNGYKESYRYSDELQADIKHPFDNVYWYATQEGAAYLAWIDDYSGSH